LQSNSNDGLRVTNAEKAYITVSDSESANNGYGISAFASSSPVFVVVRNSAISNNTNTGLVANGIGAIIYVTRSTLTGNNLDWSISVGGSVTSYSDNNWGPNATTNPGTLATASYR